MRGPVTAATSALWRPKSPLQRGDLAVDLEPDVLQACRENMVTINVTGADVDTLTDHVVVTFTAGAIGYLYADQPDVGRRV